jgi:uncharacterized protein (DUF2384 family)
MLRVACYFCSLNAAWPKMLSAAFADVFDPDLHGISPERVAAALRVQMADIARIADVHRNTLARSPASPKVQARLGEVMRILTDAADLLGGDLAKAVVWFRHQPLAGFDGQTAEELVCIGQAAAVLEHLRMLRDGIYA